MSDNNIKRLCAFVPTAKIVLDYMNDGVSEIKGMTIDDYREIFPDVVIIDFDEACSLVRESFVSPPAAIDEDRFIDMLEVLPPVDWHASGMEEHFKMSERYYGDVTSIFVRIGNDYFELCDSISLSHDDVINKVRASKVYKHVVEGHDEEQTQIPSLSVGM